jgi:hypothetical protein
MSLGLIKSVYDNQLDLLDAIVFLHAKDGFECDLTYGNGAFWARQKRPRFCYDIDPQAKWVQSGCSTAIQHDEASLGNVMFDPPFLTYVRSGRSGNGRMIMSRRFGGYWTYDELTKHYRSTLTEAARVMRSGAVLVFKCQDIVHNHRLHPTHVNVVAWADEVGFRLRDSFVFIAGHRLPSPNRVGKQKHARIFHSFFLVFERVGRKRLMAA